MRRASRNEGPPRYEKPSDLPDSGQFEDIAGFEASDAAITHTREVEHTWEMSTVGNVKRALLLWAQDVQGFEQSVLSAPSVRIAYGNDGLLVYTVTGMVRLP